MKKPFFLLPLLLISSLSIIKAGAQANFAPVGAEWWYQGSYSNNTLYPPELPHQTIYYLNWTDHCQVTKDTVIDAVPCRQLEVIREAKHSSNPDAGYWMHTFDFYIYDNTDTVFIYDDSAGHFTPLYVFNVQEGDTVSLPIPFMNGFTPGSDSFQFVIDSIKTEVFDTSHLKSFYTHNIDENGSIQNGAGWNWGDADINTGLITGKYTEKTGGSWPAASSLLPHLTEYGEYYTGNLYTDNPYGTLSCYSDSMYNIKLTDIPCDSIPNPPYVSIRSIEKLNNDITIYPNPANDYFTIQTKSSLAEDVHISLTDITGKNIATFALPKQQNGIMFDTKHLQDGLYLLILDTGKV